jgi:hypothetical protein
MLTFWQLIRHLEDHGDRAGRAWLRRQDGESRRRIGYRRDYRHRDNREADTPG